MQFGHDELGVFGYLVNSRGNSHEAVSLERQPRAELLRCEAHRVLAVPQREDRSIPNCHPDPNGFPEPHPTTALGSLWYRHTIRPECPISCRILVRTLLIVSDTSLLRKLGHAACTARVGLMAARDSLMRRRGA